MDLTVKREDEGSEGLMCGNFKFLEGKTEFKSFAAACLEAEKGIIVSPANCAILSRRALELAVKWGIASMKLYAFPIKIIYRV